jgi:hypothetical protein
MRQVYETMNTCQWDKEYQAAMYEASDRRISDRRNSERMHLVHNLAATHEASEVRISACSQNFCLQFSEKMHLEHNFPQTKQDQKDVNKDIKLRRVAARIVASYYCDEPEPLVWKKADAMAGSYGTGFRCLEDSVDPKSIRAGSIENCDLGVQQLLTLMCSGRTVLGVDID